MGWVGRREALHDLEYSVCVSWPGILTPWHRKINPIHLFDIEDRASSIRFKSS